MSSEPNRLAREVAEILRQAEQRRSQGRATLSRAAEESLRAVIAQVAPMNDEQARRVAAQLRSLFPEGAELLGEILVTLGDNQTGAASEPEGLAMAALGFAAFVLATQEPEDMLTAMAESFIFGWRAARG